VGVAGARVHTQSRIFSRTADASVLRGRRVSFAAYGWTGRPGRVGRSARVAGAGGDRERAVELGGILEHVDDVASVRLVGFMGTDLQAGKM